MSDNGAPFSSRQRLIDSLWQDARREAEQQVQKARLEDEDLVEEGRRFFEREMVLAAEKARSEALPIVSRILNHARSQARQLILEERLAFLNSCLDEVASRIANDEGFLKQARAAFEGLLEEALSAMGISAMGNPGKIEASLNPEDMSSATGVLDGKGIEHGLVGDKNIGGGVLLRARDGTMVVDDTIEGRLGVLREAPPIDLLRLISPNQDG